MTEVNIKTEKTTKKPPISDVAGSFSAGKSERKRLNPKFLYLAAFLLVASAFAVITFFYINNNNNDNGLSQNLNEVFSKQPENENQAKTWAADILRTVESQKPSSSEPKAVRQDYYIKLFALYQQSDSRQKAMDTYEIDVADKGIMLNSGQLKWLYEIFMQNESYALANKTLDNLIANSETSYKDANAEDKAIIKTSIDEYNERKKAIEEIKK